MRLNEIFSNFNNFSQFFEGCVPYIPEWSDIPREFLTALSVDYYLNNGERYVTNTVSTFIENNPRYTDDEKLDLLILLFITHNKNDIAMLYKAMFSEYNPINNYEMTETGTDIRTVEDTTTDSSTRETSDESTRDFEGEESVINNTEIKKSGFNISTPVTDSVETSNENLNNSNTETLERSANERHTGQSEKNVSESNTHTFKRSGNIGVTTSQQMIESEIKLRENNYWKIVFEKLNKTITLSIY